MRVIHGVDGETAKKAGARIISGRDLLEDE